MRIALVILNGDPRRGGAERYTVELATALRARGHEASVIASAGPADFTVEAAGWTRSGRYQSFCRGVTKQFNRERFDLVHAMLPLAGVSVDVYHPHAGVAANLGSRLGWLTNPRRRGFARAESAHASDDRTTFITLSDYVGRKLRRTYPAIPEQRIFRLFNGVDVGRFTPEGPRVDLKRRPIALFVGNDWPRKGLAEVIRVLAAVPDVHLAVAGRAKTRVETRYRLLAEKAGVADRVIWLGPRDDVPALYRSADVYCHASRHDPCSLATLEALASGLPVVGTATDGATEVMTDGVHGRIVERDGIAAGLLDVLQNQEAMRDACLELRPQLAWSAHVDRLVERYEALRADR